MGEDAPCCSSRVMDPSCLFTTDEGESVTQMRPTKHRTQRSNLRTHTVNGHEGLKTSVKIQGQAGGAIKISQRKEASSNISEDQFTSAGAASA